MGNRIAILTINDNLNYGNRLQNYALQKVLERYGDATTMRVGGREAHTSSWKDSLRTYVSLLLPGLRHAKAVRVLRSQAFTRDHVDDSQAIVDSSGIRGIGDYKPDLVVIGSDQVWNYRWLDAEMLRIRLGLSSGGIPKISYAASIGVSELAPEVIPVFAEGLNHLQYVSVREDKAKELVESCSDKSAMVVLDPTLLLSANDWRRVASSSVTPSEGYVLTYFLGRPSEHQEQIIRRYADAHGLRIRRFLDTRDLTTYAAGPREFVDLFANASYVFTDSYHACCFSVIFNKPFKVFGRAGAAAAKNINMNSRMETLFRVLGIDSNLSNEDDLPQLDYKRINERREQARRESLEWLDHAVHGTLGEECR